LRARVHEPADEAVPPGRLTEHVRAAIETDDPAAIALREFDGNEPGAGRDIEHDVVRIGSDRRDERVAPARILTEREQRAGAVVRARYAGKDARRVGGRRTGHGTSSMRGP